ncbi:MAG: acetyl-coenzyme A synthetase, partial [Gammaproteobacteria bacterium]|nr:acetyl-coenzyme A synthetase [Gammaproteobacteria bacterium]
MNKNIESVLTESRVFTPPPAFVAEARLKAHDLAALHQRAAADPQNFWAELARTEIVWHKPFTLTLDDTAAPNFRWFTDGELNVSYNCLDVQLARNAD